AGELDALVGGIHLHPVEPSVEIEVPPGTAELAVGRELQPDLLLFFDDLLDLAILDFTQVLGRDLARGALGTRLLERCRAQQAADMIGAKRRLGPSHRLLHPACRRCQMSEIDFLSSVICFPKLPPRARRSRASSPIAGPR